jgi:hypothetical protein
MLALVAVPGHAQQPKGITVVVAELLPRGPDSARYQITWTPAEDTEDLRHYLVRLMHGSRPLVSHKVPPPRTVDTLSLAIAAAGDSLGPLRARVGAIDMDGDLAESADSRTWWLRREADQEPGDGPAVAAAEGGNPGEVTEPVDSLAETTEEPADSLAEVAAASSDSAAEPAQEPADSTAAADEAEPATARPELRATALADSKVTLDGVLSEPVWATADSIGNLITIEPEEGGVPAGRTVVKVLVSPTAIIIGVRCDDPDPSGIVSFIKARDVELDDEDHIVLILDTFQDGRSGYAFAVNPNGARFDGLIVAHGTDINSEWDAIWEARTSRNGTGWSVEISIPIESISFDKALTSWGFNVERRVQRLQETSRWAGANIDYEIQQTNQAGLVTGLGKFDLGLGLTIRPALIGDGTRPEPGRSTDVSGDVSLDVTQRLGSNLLASLTVNTDFAETETDARQTNLTRFEIEFPEKRSFFLEGSDIFEFGLGLDAANLVPFFSRRIGLVDPVEGESEKIPILVGGKVNGRVGSTNLGGLVMRTNNVDRLGVPEATMGAVRIKQNVLEQSSVGMIATFGDPLGRGGSWLAGVDATYQTSAFLGEKNLLVGVWGLRNNRDGLSGNRYAYGTRIAYPNDLVDVALTAITIGDGVEPSLGFAPRTGVRLWQGVFSYNPRPSWKQVHQMVHEVGVDFFTDLDNRWESYAVSVKPFDWLLASGDRLGFTILPQGDRPPEDFDVFESPTRIVTIPAGTHQWTRFSIEGSAAEKRRVSGEVLYEFGQFYNGHLNTIEGTVAIKPWPVLTVELNAERNRGTLPDGNFTQYLFGGRVEVKPTADFQISSFVQYDNESRSLGTNSRLRWTFSPVGELFLVYNHNMLRSTGTRQRFAFESSQLLAKVQYAFRF